MAGDLEDTLARISAFVVETGDGRMLYGYLEWLAPLDLAEHPLSAGELDGICLTGERLQRVWALWRPNGKVSDDLCPIVELTDEGTREIVAASFALYMSKLLTTADSNPEETERLDALRADLFPPYDESVFDEALDAARECWGDALDES